MTDKPLSLYAKLAEVLAEVGYIEKKGYNNFHKYKYVTEQDLVEAVRSKLSSRNIVVLPSVTRVEERPVKTAKGADSCVTTVHVAFTFCDGDSSETHTCEWAGAGDDPADKGLYKAYTGAMKYFLMKAFMIPTGDDPEADQKTDERSAGGQRRAPKAISPDQRQKIADAFTAAGFEDMTMFLAAVGISSLDEATAAHAQHLRKLLDEQVAAKAAA